MFQYRLTKYNPKNRDKNGKYLNQKEWTEFMGYESNDPTFQDYLATESAYICFLVDLLVSNSQKKFQIQFCERNNLPSADSVLYEDIKYFEIKLRAYLRHTEGEWGVFITRDFAIHISSDMYVYIISKKQLPEQIYKYNKINLYLENNANVFEYIKMIDFLC
jgi:hypothetical protein